ncbi:MAG TPA: EF-hand domain-containing protein [Steroidobacteraceae bacterium]|nr:EF-hand domain-containing protein [Steroidobacteraceae bacterium]
MIASTLRRQSREFSSDELADAAEQFDACDADRDGRIGFGEYSQLVDTLGLEASPAQRRKQFDAIDTDRNGAIDRGEFIDWLRGRGG